MFPYLPIGERKEGIIGNWIPKGDWKHWNESENMQHCIIFCSEKSDTRREQLRQQIGHVLSMGLMPCWISHRPLRMFGSNHRQLLAVGKLCVLLTSFLLHNGGSLCDKSINTYFLILVFQKDQQLLKNVLILKLRRKHTSQCLPKEISQLCQIFKQNQDVYRRKPCHVQVANFSVLR